MVAINNAHIGKTCPFCQYPIKSDSEVVICSECQIPHHQECWQENGGCTTYGCKGTDKKEQASEASEEQLEVDLEEPADSKARQPISEKTGRLLIGLGAGLMVLLAVIAFVAVRTAYFDGNGWSQRSTYDPTLIATLDADYYIDYEHGTIPIGDLPIGSRVVDPSWQWEYRLGVNYSNIDWEGDPTPAGEVKPVTWIVVAHNHYNLTDSHVTLLSEELIGRFSFDDSTNRGSSYGINHWGDSGTGNANHGLRPWLNSTGIPPGGGFYRAFSERFKSAMLTTTVPNRESKNGTVYSTQDYVFIPSTTELGDSTHNFTYRIGDVYAYFSDGSSAKRIALLGGEVRWYWTRSPYSNSGDRVRAISGTGEFFSNYHADYDNIGVRPALNLKSEILVSEIRD